MRTPPRIPFAYLLGRFSVWWYGMAKKPHFSLFRGKIENPLNKLKNDDKVQNPPNTNTT
tara:strand:- start:96 stop:272 length:177 start_codon:yes stop_codon:yes gene_type:complete